MARRASSELLVAIEWEANRKKSVQAFLSDNLSIRVLERAGF